MKLLTTSFDIVSGTNYPKALNY